MAPFSAPRLLLLGAEDLVSHKLAKEMKEDEIAKPAAWSEPGGRAEPNDLSIKTRLHMDSDKRCREAQKEGDPQLPAGIASLP